MMRGFAGSVRVPLSTGPPLDELELLELLEPDPLELPPELPELDPLELIDLPASGCPASGAPPDPELDEEVEPEPELEPELPDELELDPSPPSGDEFGGDDEHAVAMAAAPASARHAAALVVRRKPCGGRWMVTACRYLTSSQRLRGLCSGGAPVAVAVGNLKGKRLIPCERMVLHRGTNASCTPGGSESGVAS
jgi:hypothetical protein